MGIIVEVIEIEGKDLDKWDKLVDSSVQGTIFQKTDWLFSFRDNSNARLKIYGCFHQGDLVGGCAVFVRNKALFKEAVSTMNMMPYNGVLLSPDPSKHQNSRNDRAWKIIKTLIDAMGNEHFQKISLRNSYDFVDIRPFLWNGWTGSIYYTHTLDLSDNILSNMDKSGRQCYQKGLKGKFAIKKLADPQAYYKLLEMTLIKKGVKHFPTVDLFNRVLGANGHKPLAEMWVAQAPTGEIASSQIIAFDAKRAYIWSEATHTNYRGSGSNCLLQQEVYKDLFARDFKEVDIFRGNVPQLAVYASHLNPRLTPYFVVEKMSLSYKFASVVYESMAAFTRPRN